MKKRKNLIIYFIAIVLGLFLGFCHPEGKIDFLVNQASKKSLKSYDGWRTNLTIGQESQGMMMRAIVARVGLGANTKDEAIYLSTIKDTKGEMLNSENEYKIILNKELPVDAFWSFTLYGADDYLIKNDYNKYGVSSFDNLAKREDGSIVIVLSKDKPANPENWIPLPKDNQNLNLTLRCYQPKDELKNNIEAVELPVIKKVVKGDI